MNDHIHTCSRCRPAPAKPSAGVRREALEAAIRTSPIGETATQLVARADTIARYLADGTVSQ